MTIPALPSEPAASGSTDAPPPRDSLFSERVRWTGTPNQVVASSLHRAMTWLLAGSSLISTLLAIANSQVGNEGTGNLILFAAWCATFALGVRTIPVFFAQAARFTITDRHVIWQGGRLKRTIQRSGISFARITWHTKNPNVGDIDLVRAVPTGALHRRLTLTLQGVSSPHRVWAIVRGVPSPVGQQGGGDVPPEQRLDEGESLRWSAVPMRSLRAWLPLTMRRTLTTALGVLCSMIAIRTLIVGLSLFGRLLESGIPWASLAFFSVMAAIGLTVLVLSSLGGWFFHVGITSKAWMDRRTRYLITDQRFILVRGRRELHIDRSAIIDVVERSGLYGGKDAYLILDGPHSRAVSAQGAFGPGEKVRGFRPMLQGLTENQIRRLHKEISNKKAH